MKKNDNVHELQTVSDQDGIIATLQNSLYIGSKPESIKMVIAYCQAAGLDAMQKPVHIVPMSVKNPQTGNYEFRDIIMPGIGMYRIQADRSGSLAGAGEPEFGKEMTSEFTDKNGNKCNFNYPEWCRVSMKKLVGNHIVEFIAKEYWLENYATDSRNSSAPNAMWKKRPKGQLAKCAEAQALRKGWPEIGQAPTAEEMEGKIIDMGEVDRSDDYSESEPEAILIPEYQQSEFDKNFAIWEKLIKNGKQTPDSVINKIESKYTMTENQKNKLKKISGESNADS